MIVYIALGSNLEDRHMLLKNAINEMQKYGLNVIKSSSVIETKPYGKTDQPDFLNQVVQIDTDLEPLKLLSVLNSIEHDLGRVRHERWGARTIDLDIIFYADEIIDTPTLKIPHYDMQSRYFVLKPMAEIAPDYIHPIFKKTITQLLESL